MNNKKRAIEGIKWNYLSVIGLAVAQIAFAAVLARLLEPATFGIMAMANMMIKFGRYFTGTGIRSYLIQKTDVDEGDIQATFLLTVTIGMVLAILVFSLAPVGGLVFGSAAVEPVIRALSIVYIFASIAITSNALLQRAMRFKVISIIEIVAYVASYLLVAIPLALSGQGVWALVYAMLCQQLLLMVMTYYFSRHTIGVRFNRAKLWEVMLPGTHYSINSILEFIINSMPTLIIGRSLGEARLGIYNRANMLVSLPTYNISVAVARVFFPYIARIQHDIERFKQVYVKAATLTSLIYIPLCLGMIPAAREITLVILGDKWVDGIPVFQVLAIAMMFHFASMFPGQCGDALRHLRERTIVLLLTIPVMAAAIAGLLGWDMVGAAAGFAIGQAFRFGVYMWLIRRWIAPTSYEYAHMFFPGLVVGLAVMFVVGIVHTLVQLSPLILKLMLEILAGGAIYLLALLWVPSQQLNGALHSVISPFEEESRSWIVVKALRMLKYRLG